MLFLSWLQIKRDLVKHRLNFVLISDPFSLTFAGLQFEHKEAPGITVPNCPFNLY